MDRDTFREMRESGANAPPPATATEPTFKAGDLVKLLKADPFLTEMGINEGDVVQVKEAASHILCLKRG